MHDGLRGPIGDVCTEYVVELVQARERTNSKLCSRIVGSDAMDRDHTFDSQRTREGTAQRRQRPNDHRLPWRASELGVRIRY